MELLLETAGESHGEELTAILVGIPAGTPISLAAIDAALAARQRGHGRSARQRTERDVVRLSAGVRRGASDDALVATGNPIALHVRNRDVTYADLPPVRAPRPGHADLAGALNRGLLDARDVIERASARETAVRVAAGAVAAELLRALGIGVLGHVLEVGGVRVGGEVADDAAGRPSDPADPAVERGRALRARRDASPLHALGAEADVARAIAAIDAAKTAGDTLGGVVEVVADGCPAGLGGHERPEEKLSARLAAAVVGVQAVRAFEIGDGFASAALLGSRCHDPILPRPGEGARLRRPTNRAGGIEGGTSNGERIVVRAAMKPLATLRDALPSVDLVGGAAAPARVERSDVTAVPALAIVLEAVVALELARALRRRFGGAHLDEVREAVAAHARRAATLGRRAPEGPSRVVGS